MAGFARWSVVTLVSTPYIEWERVKPPRPDSLEACMMWVCVVVWVCVTQDSLVNNGSEQQGLDSGRACSGAVLTCRQGQSRGVGTRIVVRLPWTGWFTPEHAPPCTLLYIACCAHPTSCLVSRVPFYHFTLLSTLSYASPRQELRAAGWVVCW